MDTLFRDIRYGFRGLLKRPGFTAIALIALALGIGANTAIVSLVNAVILQPLPYPEPDRLVWVWGKFSGGNRASVSPPDFLDFRSQNKTFEQFAATFSIPVPVNITGGGEPERLSASAVTGNYFQTLGVAPALGRGFSIDNEKSGNNQVTILSHALWQKRFGADPGIINQRINLDGKSFEVIGVMAKDITFPQTAALWVPINFDDADPAIKLRAAHFMRPLGRLKPGVTLAQAQADTDAIAAQLEQQFPETNTGWSLRLEPLHERLVGSSRTTVFVLFGAVGFVLLIACANVANLLLVRAASRQREVALRTAVGASRWRIIRQLMTESMLLAVIGGALGALIAAWGMDLLVKLTADSLPSTVNVKIDGTVLAFTLLTSLITGLLFGVLPALRTAKLNLSDALKEGGRSGEGTLRNRTRSLLVVFESAVAVMLLVSAGLLIRSLIALQNTDPGFDAQNVLTMRVDLARTKYNTGEKTANFFQQLEQRVSGLPGVETVGFATELPLSGQANDTPFTVEGRTTAPGQKFGADWRRVNHNYFQALRMPLLRGRNFTEQEVSQNAKVVIVSQQLIDVVFPNEEPLGKRLLMVIDDDPYEIVGIVGDIRHRSLQFGPYAAIYMPTRQPGGNNLVIRTQGDPLSLVPSIRKEVQAMDPDQPVAAIRTMEDWVGLSVSTPRYRTTLLALFAGLAMVLAATGIYGVMSYSVAQRTHEIGVRMALGARRVDVLGLVVRQGMLLVVIGLMLGLAGAFALTRVMASLLFGVTAKDPITFVAVAGLLSVVALIACYIPARRATKVDPLTALRYE